LLYSKTINTQNAAGSLQHFALFLDYVIRSQSLWRAFSKINSLLLKY